MTPPIVQPVYDPSRFQPLRVTARLAEQIIYFGDGLHLDSILAWAAFMRLPRDARESLPPVDLCDFPIDIELPLARWRVPCSDPSTLADARLLDADGMIWGWRATAALADWELKSSAEWRRKPPLGEYMRHTSEKRMETGAGPYKAYNVSVPTVFAHSVSWECVGDIDAVRLLLSDIHCLGKKHQRGSGRLLQRDDGSPQWDVEPVDGGADHGIEIAADGHLLARAMPAEYVTGRGLRTGGTIMISVRAPYHHYSRRCWGHAPGTVV